MNAPAVVFVSIVLSAGVAFGVTSLAAPEAAAPPAHDAAAVDSLRQELADLGGRVAQLSSAQEAAPAVRSDVDADLDRRIEEAVARALAGRDSTIAAEAAPVVEVDAAVVELLESGVLGDQADALWARVRAAGKADEVVAAFARRAAENPGSADAQTDYGEAVAAQIMHAESSMAQAQLAVKSDAAYDKALELDSTHWRARFNKAVGYSFWPPITGKPAEAVTHFETLMTQQEARPDPANDGYPSTYLILGNLLEQQGKGDEAKAVWERGLRTHPDSSDLAGRLGR